MKTGNKANAYLPDDERRYTGDSANPLMKRGDRHNSTERQQHELSVLYPLKGGIHITTSKSSPRPGTVTANFSFTFTKASLS